MRKNYVTTVKRSLSSSELKRNISSFLELNRSDIQGIKIDVSVKNSRGEWSTLHQRLFKNGAVHSRIS